MLQHTRADQLGASALQNVIRMVAETQINLVEAEGLYQAMEFLLHGKISPFLVPHKTMNDSLHQIRQHLQQTDSHMMTLSSRMRRCSWRLKPRAKLELEIGTANGDRIILPVMDLPQMAQNYQVSATRSRMDVLLSNPGCCKRAKLGINPLSIVVYDQLLQYQLDIPQNLPIPLTQIFKIQNILTHRYYLVLHVVTAKNNVIVQSLLARPPSPSSRLIEYQSRDPPTWIAQTEQDHERTLDRR